MELDVHIVREANRTWGFTLVGGNDSEIPLTVIKVLSDSPADRAGLQNGDTILRIDNVQATDMSHAVASKAVNAAEDSLVLGVVRGLYDPVLDDFEPLYEPIDQEDLDRLSEPTEVPFKVPEFIEVPPPLDSRSLTASPFVQPIKPYRPFSTEPTDIPPLEDPIILNPNYKDTFPQHEVEDILQVKPDLPPESRFKLPISEQYDPEGKKIKRIQQDSNYEKTIDLKKEEEIREEQRETRTTQRQMKEKIIQQDAEYMELMKKEIDLEKIEMTASEVVEESIEKAISVAKEIDIEIKSHENVQKTGIKSKARETKFEMEIKSESSQERQETKVEEDVRVVSDLVELIDKTTDEIIKESGTKDVKKQVEVTSQQDSVVKERRMSSKQEIEETIKAESSRRQSTIIKSEAQPREHEKDIERKQLGNRVLQEKQESQTEVQHKKEVDVDIEKQSRSNKISTSRLLAEQRAYTIGLQTIPNIRGSIHASYQYNLLLKTFFIHLTDVMVALSRFILTEPVFSDDKEKVSENQVTVSKTVKKDDIKHASQAKEAEKSQLLQKQEILHDRQTLDKRDVDLKASEIKKHKDISDSQNIEERIEIVEDNRLTLDRIKNEKITAEKTTNKQTKEWTEEKEIVAEDYDEEFYEDEEFIETRRKRGAEMAQRSERKSAELMDKLDAVITEFQAKAGIEETDKNISVQRRTRSRSRSKAQEKALRESEALDISSKVDKQIHEITAMQTMSSSRSYEDTKSERKHETRQLKTPVPHTTEDGKIMYVAIVESHIYTNPDAIIEESTTTSESMETSKTERVSMESTVKKEEVAETVIQKAQEILQKTVEVIQPIQVVEDVKSVQTQQASTVIEMSATDIAQSSEVSIEEVKDEILKVKEPLPQALEVTYEAIAKSVAESTEAYVEEVKTENLETPQHKILQAKEIIETVAKTVAEASEVSVEEVKHEEFEVQKATTTQAAEVLVEDKVTAVAETTVVPVERGKTYDEASAELKIVKFVPTEVEEPVVVISEVELALHKRDVADAKIYESIVGVETAVQENREYLDVSQVATFKSVGETKLDKTVNIEEIEEIPVQVIEKTEVSIEGLNETDTEMYQSELVKQSTEQSSEAKAITLNTEVENTSIQQATHIEQATNIQEAISKVETSIEAQSTSEVSVHKKSVVEASIETDSTSEVSLEAKSISAQKQVEKSVEQVFESSVSEKSQKSSLESAEKCTQQEIAKEVSVEELTEKSVTNKTDQLSPPAPETPVTDEYMFKLEIPLPKSRGGTPVPRDCTPPDDEDPHIVKKKLVPHIDTSIESYIFEPPLPTPPPGRELGSPEYRKPGLQGGSNRLKNMRYIKPGLRGGSDRPEMTKEEIMEIERTSSLLASAIDKTLKSIEEYKEEVGIEEKKEINVSSKMVTSSKVEHKTVSSNIHSNGSIKESVTASKDSYEKEWKEIEKQVQVNDNDVNELSINVTIEGSNGDTKNGKTSNDDRVQIIEVEVSAHHNGNLQNGFDNISNETKTDNATKINKNEHLRKSTTKSLSEANENDEALDITSEKESMKSYETSKVNSDIKETPQNVQNSAGDESVRDTSTHQTQNGASNKIVTIEEPKVDPMQLYKPVKFDPQEIARRNQMTRVPIIQEPAQACDTKPKVYMTDTGEIIGSHQGIVDGLEEAVVDSEVAKALGKPGMPDEKIAELISGEAEMLREAHVMGVDFQKIKPVIESLKDSEVLKALNEEVLRVKEQKKKEEKKWTTFLQKPKRPVPRPKYGYYRHVEEEQAEETPYKVKIVKQPKPKVAPDYKPEDFDTGPLPWEQPQPELIPGAPPVEPEEPILIPEESPEFLEAVDPLPESEVPDLEDTGIPLPPPPPEPIHIQSPLPEQPDDTQEIPEELDIEAVAEETEQIVEEMEGDMLAQQLLQNVQKMVDPNATLEQQLGQMRAQIAALAQLPCVIQQTLDLVTRQITQLSHKEPQKTQANQYQEAEDNENALSVDVCLPLPAARPCRAFHFILNDDQQESGEERQQQPTIIEPEEEQEHSRENNVDVVEERVPMLSEEELARRRQQEEEMLAEQQKIEKQRKIEHWNKIWPWGNSKNPHCRKYRINFMKYEKPPVSLDHLQRSEVYKVVHDLDETPLKRVETRTPVIAEADYRERCRSISPYPTEKHVSIPQQLQP